MAYFLGRDVKVGITTEDESNGVQVTDSTPTIIAATSTTDTGDVIEHLGAQTMANNTPPTPTEGDTQ